MMKTRADAAALAEEIKKRLKALSKPSAEKIRDVRRKFTKRIEHESPRLVFSVAEHLLDELGFAQRLVAYELVKFHPSAAATLGEAELRKLGRDLASWSDVDTFAVYLSGPAWREGGISDQVVRKWALSEDHWWRRTALVSTVPLNSKAQGGSGDLKRTLSICRILIDDRDDMVVKALSWALRELSKRYPQEVAEFLDKNDDRIAARVRREVQNKLETGLKNPRRV